jgi:hypothetical protein
LVETRLTMLSVEPRTSCCFLRLHQRKDSRLSLAQNSRPLEQGRFDYAKGLDAESAGDDWVTKNQKENTELDQAQQGDPHVHKKGPGEETK